MQKIIVLAPQISTGDNRQDRHQKHNPSSFSRRRHQTSNSTQKHRRRRQSCNSINEEPNGSSAILRTTTSLGGVDELYRPTGPESALRSPAGRFCSCIGHFGRRATNEITLSMDVWALCWHSHSRECLDLWWNWLAERGQHQSAAGVLGSDGKLIGSIISARASESENIYPATTCMAFTPPSLL